jgi:hypothetical protein
MKNEITIVYTHYGKFVRPVACGEKSLLDFPFFSRECDTS